MVIYPLRIIKGTGLVVMYLMLLTYVNMTKDKSQLLQVVKWMLFLKPFSTAWVL